MNILSLDMSTRATGWAIINIKKKKIVKCGVIRASDKKMDIKERFHFMMDEINKLMGDDISIVVFEDVYLTSHNNVDVLKKLCILQGMITALSLANKKEYSSMLPGEWRKRIGLHESMFKCKKCGEEFALKTSDENPECCKCGNKAKTTFSKSSLNSREELKLRAVKMCNNKLKMKLEYTKNNNSDDDIAEAILIGFSYIGGI